MAPGARYRQRRELLATLGLVVLLLICSLTGALSAPTARAAVSTSSADATYSVTFVASGLPPGTLWLSTLGKYWVFSNNSSATTENVANGTYSYTVMAQNYATANSTASVTVDGANATVPLQFYRAPYAVTFVESGLPGGLLLNVTLAGFFTETGYPSVTFYESPGWYSFSVLSYGTNYTANPSNSGVSVGDSNQTIDITFEAQNQTPHYAVSFWERGLVPGTPWTVALTGNGTSWAPDPPNETITSVDPYANFSLPNGVYSGTVSEIPGYYTDPNVGIEVYNAPTGVEVEYGTSPYRNGNLSLTFHEIGLPQGTNWSVGIGNLVETSANSNVTWWEDNGTYNYSVQPVSGYAATHTGSVALNGDVAVMITFGPTYAVEFVEQGLPSGDKWSVTATDASTGFDQTRSSVTNSVTLSLPNGTYQIGLTLPSGWTGTLSATGFTVDGLAVSGPTVTATEVTANSPGPVFSDWTLVYVASATAVILAVVGVVVITVRRRRKPPFLSESELGQA